MRKKKSSPLRNVEYRVLLALFELGMAGVSPRVAGLLALLKGNEEARLYDGLDSFGAYVSMGSKRLGMLLHSLEKEGYLALDEDGYATLSPKGKEMARLAPECLINHARGEAKSLPLFKTLR